MPMGSRAKNKIFSSKNSSLRYFLFSCSLFFLLKIKYYTWAKGIQVWGREKKNIFNNSKTKTSKFLDSSARVFCDVFFGYLWEERVPKRCLVRCIYFPISSFSRFLIKKFFWEIFSYLSEILLVRNSFLLQRRTARFLRK